MVEIQQAQRDRHLNTSIGIASVGLATSQIASAVIIDQQNRPEKVAFYQTQAFWVSIGTGAIAKRCAQGAIASFIFGVAESMYENDFV